MSKKSTEVEVQRRIGEVLRMRLEGAQLWDVRLYSARARWGVSDSMLKKYIARADATIRASLCKDRQRIFQEHLARRELLYQRCVGCGEYATALAVLRDAAELQDIYPDARSKNLTPGVEPVVVQFICVPGTAPVREVIDQQPAPLAAPQPQEEEPIHLIHPAEANPPGLGP
jgi:hypothetical protein